VLQLKPSGTTSVLPALPPIPAVPETSLVVPASTNLPAAPVALPPLPAPPLGSGLYGSFATQELMETAANAAIQRAPRHRSAHETLPKTCTFTQLHPIQGAFAPPTQ
jgi:hypothetical protein